MEKPGIYTAIIIVIIFLFETVSAQHGHKQAMQDHGKVNFETSCNMEAQPRFNHGLGMLHHMMYDQAADIFNEALTADPDCAMAYWGVAMTQLNPLWAPPNEKTFKKGFDAIKKGAGAGNPTEKELDYIRALKAYYTTMDESGFRNGLKAWERELGKVHKKYPDDIDAGAFYGLSLLATASRDDETFSQQAKAGALLEALYERAPEHPGLFHYIIHAYDNPVLADKGVAFAHGYDKLAPNVPHALHMPSHIFVRIGEWDETIDWNRRSADAALEQPVGIMTSMHHAHALDYMMYAYLQQGRDKHAREVLDELNIAKNYQPGVAAYNITAAQARYPLERRQWEEAAKLPLRVHSEFPWDDYPEFEAITWWARGLGAARSGNSRSAREAVKELKNLHERTLQKGEEYWALLVDVQRQTVEAWILQEEGKHEEALAMMRKAADQEDSVDKHPVTPSAVLPARELLGDMFLLQEKSEEALAAYRKALNVSPNRFNSLYGAGMAAKMAGKNELANDYFATLYSITVPGESPRAELIQVSSVLPGN
jgi:tetratricopeptide (TPR) repeat protein